MKLFAVRNLRLCTKDCLCLYVCPTGASDTEDSIIDVKTCIGCGTCAAACPGGAISMVPYDYPPQQKKARAVLDHAAVLAESKARQEAAARSLGACAGADGLARLCAAAPAFSAAWGETAGRDAACGRPARGQPPLRSIQRF